LFDFVVLYYNRTMQKHTILASQSPRRRELLNLMGIPFTTVNPNVDEVINPNLSLENAIEELAYIKALDVLNRHPEANIISADTIVVCENEVMGKPVNEEDAIRMLKQLSGKKHEVITGVCLLSSEKEIRFHTKTLVEFYEYNEEFVKAYVQSKVPLDKAGAYGIQDKGALLVKGIEGDYYTVMGLPISELYRALKKFNQEG
jgi:septum formation protein